jgi:hypothetical protein
MSTPLTVARKKRRKKSYWARRVTDLEARVAALEAQVILRQAPVTPVLQAGGPLGGG